MNYLIFKILTIINNKKYYFCIFTILFLPLLCIGENNKLPSLTNEEINWIKNHTKIKAGFDSNWPPFEFANKEGEHKGISAEILKIIEQDTGLKITMVTDKWVELMKKFKAGELDLLPAVLVDDKRESYGTYTTPYYLIDNFIFVKENNKDIHNFKDLIGKTVALPKGYTLSLKIAKEYPQIKIFYTDNILGSLFAVLYGQADATIESQAIVNYTIQKNSISGIKGLVQATLDSSELAILVQKDQKTLYSIIQKSLDIILQKDIINIKKKFFIQARKDVSKSIKLTPQEKEWLKNHPVIRFTGDPNWLPYEAFKDGKYIGIVAEYLKIIESRLNIKFKKIVTKNWEESVQMAKEHDVDVLSETTDSELKSHLIFTDSYLDNLIVIIMNDNQSYVEKINHIRDKKIAVIKDYGYVPNILKKYPKIKFIQVDNIQDGLTAVSTGKIDALLCTMALGSYTISKMGINNIKTVGKTEFSTKIGLGVRKDYKPLVAILNKAIRTITNKEKRDILNEWTYHKYAPTINWEIIRNISILFLLFIIFSLYWNHKINKAKKELHSQKQKLESISQQLSKYLSPQIYDMIFSGEQDMHISSKRKKLTIFFSDIVGFTPLTEDLESEELTDLLNHYMTEMAKIALKHGATIDKYIGDAIVIFFGDPTSNGYRQDALNCVKMAMEMQEKNREIRAHLVNEGIVSDFQMRIGINTGYCTVGNFGSDDRMDYTIIGGQVNLASRLETNAEPSGILISHETYSLVKEEVKCTSKGEVKVKGISKSIKTYQVESIDEKKI